MSWELDLDWLRATDGASLMRELEVVLTQVLSEDLYATVAIDFGTPSGGEWIRYVQAIVSDDELHLETVSNEFLRCVDGVEPLTAADEERLRRLGWSRPGSCPNFSRDVPLDRPGVLLLATDMLARTLIDVHRWTPARSTSVTYGHASEI